MASTKNKEQFNYPKIPTLSKTLVPELPKCLCPKLPALPVCGKGKKNV